MITTLAIVAFIWFLPILVMLWWIINPKYQLFTDNGEALEYFFASCIPGIGLFLVVAWWYDEHKGKFEAWKNRPLHAPPQPQPQKPPKPNASEFIAVEKLKLIQILTESGFDTEDVEKIIAEVSYHSNQIEDLKKLEDLKNFYIFSS
jgi:hypothetical protein